MKTFLAVCHIGILWLCTLEVCIAQETVYLNLKLDKLQYAREVEQEAKLKNDSLLLAEAWYLYGKLYVFAGDYHTSQTYFLKSLRIQEPRGDSFELSRLYVRLCENETRLGRLNQALHYAYLSLQMAQRIHSDKALIRAYDALGRVYRAIWNGQLPNKGAEYERVLSYFKKVEQLCYKLKDTSGIAEANLELGKLFIKVKDPQAIPSLKKALYLFTLKTKDALLVITMTQLSSAYLTFGEPKLAIQALNKAEKIYNYKKLNDYDSRLGLETQFVNYFEVSGEWEKAFKRLRRLNELERIRLLADRNGALTRLNVEYETEKKETLLKTQNRELSLRTQNLKTQQRFTWSASSLFILAMGMSIVFFRLYRKNQRISRRNEELLKEQNHRVKNNLQVVSSLLSLQSKRLTDDVAKKAIEESRLRVQSMAIIHQRLYDGDKLAEVNLADFIQELVIGVLRTYGYDTIQPKFSIDESSLAADKAVPMGLILNELMTNACKYAFPGSENPDLQISCHRRSQTISLRVSDNGPGWTGDTDYPRSQPEHGNIEQMTLQKASFGMQLIQAQVDQLYGTHQFQANKSGVVFTMEFNV